MKVNIPDNVQFRPEAAEDLKKLDGSVRKRVIKQICKVSENPRSKTDGGLGIPLGNKLKNNLTGYLEIKLKSDGIRCIYKCIMKDPDMDLMDVIIISVRKDEQVYAEAYERIKKIKEDFRSDTSAKTEGSEGNEEV